MPFCLWPHYSVTPNNLYRHGILMCHNSRFQGPIKAAKQKILGLGPQYLGSFQLLRTRLKQAQLLLLLFML